LQPFSVMRMYALLGLMLVACSVSEPSSPGTSRVGSDNPQQNNDSIPPPPPPPDTVSIGTVGTIGGGVATEGSVSLANVSGAAVWLYRGDPAQPQAATLIATGRSTLINGFEGAFQFDSVPVGSYFVRAESDDPTLAPGQSPRIDLRGGRNVSVGVFLADVGARGVPYVRIWPRRLVATDELITIARCGAVYLHVFAGDEHGEPIVDKSGVEWRTSNGAVAVLGDITPDSWGAYRTVYALGVGDATITAMNGSMGDSIRMRVLPNSIDCGTVVKQVVIMPDSAGIVVGATVALSAYVRELTGAIVPNADIRWVVSDTTVVTMRVDGTRVFVTGRKAGRASIRASSDTLSADAAVIVQ